ncbi:uncharacterized protein M6B38_344620 [Iris pallida]|uniref:Transmembrane protein n=1 Tax=Iris pallida TaxID=29817 RepID=A0AAX6GVW0_IRIPA|nr:Uncharacterized protein M6B38_235650 [Iris pallida]KAJ6798800.1 Uncharacterized protein M6B38_211045 [Iris pallida]KAJ6832461.1 uncharacterized protein M6B38_344620 [Iris pallida]
MGIYNQTKPSGALKILWEGLKLPVNNCKLLRPVVTVSFLSSALLFIFFYLRLLPLVFDLTFKSILIRETNPESPEFSLLLNAILRDLKELGIIEVILLTISFVVNSLLVIAIVHVLSDAYASKTAASKVKELSSGLNWPLIKRGMITQAFVAFFLRLGCTLMLTLAAGALPFAYVYSRYFSRSHVESAVVVVSGAFVAALAFYWYLYLFVVAQMSVVVSIAEEGCYGLEAIAKACRLIRGGRRQAILIAFLEVAPAVVFYTGYGIAIAHIPPTKLAQLAVGVGQLAVGVVIGVLVWSVHTVYYYERSKIRAEEMATEGGFKYNPVPTQVDEALP